MKSKGETGEEKRILSCVSLSKHKYENAAPCQPFHVMGCAFISTDITWKGWQGAAFSYLCFDKLTQLKIRFSSPVSPFDFILDFSNYFSSTKVFLVY